MRCIVSSVEEFIECLSLPDETVFQNAIHLSITQNPVGNKPHEAMKFDVYATVSAVVRCSDGSEYILEFGKKCGVDYTDGSGAANGTTEASKIKTAIKEYAGQRGLLVLPGLLDY